MGLWHRTLAVCFRKSQALVYRMLWGIVEKRAPLETTAVERKDTDI